MNGKSIRFSGRKIVTAFLISAILFINSMSICMAYSHATGAVKFLTDQYNLTYSYTQSGTYSYSSAIRSGINAWNNSAARIYVKSSTGSVANIRMVSTDYGNVGWHGRCYYPTIIDRAALIQINDYYRSEFSGNEAELVAHEMGHAFTLADSSDMTVLMRSSGYKGSPTPAQDDVNGVNAKY